MRAGRHPITGETEIYLNAEETELMKEMVQGATLSLRRVFYQLTKL